MLSDRPYMRSEYPRGATAAYVWLTCTIAAAFVLQLILLSPKLGGTAFVFEQVALTVEAIRGWRLWTLLTHCLLHSTDSPWHIIFTVTGMIFVGRELEPLVGTRRFVALFAGMVLTGGLAWTAVNWTHASLHIGAGAAVFGFLLVLSRIQPQLEFGLFFFPVRFNIRHIVYVLLGANVLGLFFYEIPGGALPLGLTPSAHLGGMLAGWVYFRFLHAGNGWDRAPGMSLPAWLRWPKRKAAAKTPPGPAPKARPRLRAEVDQILDKINSQGFGALTDEEKRILDEAKDLLSRH
jgi:membrane associated rhomboid family serine protease